ncbi:MAG: hypothetical protein HQK75_02310 [Candidatus Magnetomorum sp.]|nr:hypothetical protein [Candidatus Magnetomorum sp.]
MINDHEALMGRIKENISDLKDVVARAELLLKKSEYTNDDGYLDGAALNLHGFYSGVEQIFKDIARTVDKSIPTSHSWHKDLLIQMSAELSSIRPSVIHKETRHCLEEYLSFRHVVRNVYAFNLKSSRLKELIQDLRVCFESLQREMNSFITFLEQIAGSK